MKCFLLLSEMLLFSCSLFGQSDISQKQYLDEVFAIIENHSIRRDSIDFENIKERAYARLSKNPSKSIVDCYPIIRDVLLDLGDHHSFFLDKAQATQWKTTSATRDIKEMITFNGELLEGNIGYINIGGFSSGDSLSILKYADSLQTLIKSIDNKEIKGWILDLRKNSGGNCWPMLAGVGPLLGNGICGYFVDNDNKWYAWSYNNGFASNESVPVTTVSIEHYELQYSENPIAILTGHNTASSGEILVVAFRGKANTKSFGHSTHGLSTGNAKYELSDGSSLFLTTSVYADRNRTLYGGKIEPDDIVQSSTNTSQSANDIVIDKAKNWILGSFH